MIHEIQVLDHGYVRLHNIASMVRRPELEFDAISTDPALVARVSFNNLLKEESKEKDMGLVNYLQTNHHCFYETMQVLTAEGWKYWKDCSKEESFLVPNPETLTLQEEKLEIISYDIEDTTMYCMKNARMEYCVTEDHSLWIKGQYDKDFSKQKAKTANSWGIHQHSAFYSKFTAKGEKDPKFSLLGFFLGDGSFSSKNKITFHLKKERKIEFLKELLEVLNLEYVERKDIEGTALTYTLEVPYWFKDYIPTSFENRYKKFNLGYLRLLKAEELRGLWSGLSRSDGYVNKEKQRVEFSSTSLDLIELFEVVSAYLGLAAHRIKTLNGVHRIHARVRPENLNRKGIYLTTEKKSGKVFCTTTSTGLLVVRGNENSSGFICGNSTPIEFTTVWLEFKMPLFVARQFDTVRTRSKNELSGRYKELPRQWYLPEIARGKPSGSIKQGSGASMDENDTQWLRHTLDYQCTRAWDNYDAAIERGIAPELARMYLSLNNYTIFAYKQDLHNLTNNFLRLRLDKHAQWETRQYAIAIHDLLKQVLPEWMELWDAQQEQKERDKRELAVLRTVVVNQQEQLERLKRASVLANCGTGEETI